MKLLLDTQAFIWAGLDDSRLGEPARHALTDPANHVFVSAVTAWEIAVKAALGRIRANPDSVADAIADGQMVELPIAIAHASQAGRLPLHHRDPFDRMLVAQAQVEGARLVTHDKAFAAYDVDVLWT